MADRSIRDVLSQDGASLRTALTLSPNEARIEVQMLLQQALHVTRAYLLAHPEQMLGADQQAEYHSWLQRRMQGEPIAHILGEREFFGMNFKITPATLIPRPDTELLVELALQRIPRQGLVRVLDLGTGSGAIALSIARHRPEVEVTAVDTSEAALAVAQENARSLGISNVRFLFSDWFAAMGGQRYQLIVSNPPYIAEDDEHLAEGDVRFEPLSALVSGCDGLEDIRRIILQAEDYLEEGGCLLLEHGYDQAQSVRELLQQKGYADVFSAKDIAGIERVSGGINTKIQ